MLTRSSAPTRHGTPPASLPRSGNVEPANGDPAVAAPGGEFPASLREKALRPQTLISFAVALALLWFALRRLDLDPAALWQQMQQANPLLLAVAFCLWYGAFFVRGWRWGRMLESAGMAEPATSQIPSTPGLAQIVLLAFFANSLAPAKLGDAYRAYLLREEGGIPFSAGLGTILAERLADAMMLVVVLAGSALVVFGRSMPAEASPALTLGTLLLVAGLVALSAMWLTRDLLARRLPARISEIYTTLHGAVFGALRRPALVLGIGLLLWLGDGMRVWFVAHALDLHLPPTVTILIAVMGALLTVIPFTPAGLGVVELGVSSILVGVLGVDPVLAGAVILLDRVVAYWSLLLVGGALYLWRLRQPRPGPSAAAPRQPAT